MTFKPVSLVRVFFMRGTDKLFMGRLVLKDRRIYFEYTAEFIRSGLELSPFILPLKPGVMTPDDRMFEGLFGLFNDSLPDGWGRLLLDRNLMKQGLVPGSMSPLDRLCFVGKHGMGALIYEPDTGSDAPRPLTGLDEIADEILQFQEHDDDRFVDELLNLNGSSAGARPKIMVRIGDEDWIIKFRSTLDPKDIGPIEYAYHRMAQEAGLDVPDAKLFPSRHGPGYFGVKRFDRIHGKRCHMHTISGLLHADHREPCLDYETIMKATLWLTKDMREGEKQFRAAVFNVLSHNRDDHAKNFSFVMDEQGLWRISPSYDLTFSTGPGGEHCSIIMGEGKTPGLTQLLALSKVAGITGEHASRILDEVSAAIAKWDNFSSESGVSQASRKTIQMALNRIALSDPKK